MSFEVYVIRDAVITLKHALSMEKFNIRIKQIGIPLTLSSIWLIYVFEAWISFIKVWIIINNILIDATALPFLIK